MGCREHGINCAVDCNLYMFMKNSQRFTTCTMLIGDIMATARRQIIILHAIRHFAGHKQPESLAFGNLQTCALIAATLHNSICPVEICHIAIQKWETAKIVRDRAKREPSQTGITAMCLDHPSADFVLLPNGLPLMLSSCTSKFSVALGGISATPLLPYACAQ